MASKLNLIVDQGSTFQIPVTVNSSNGAPVNLSGCSVYAQARRWYTSNTIVAQFTTTVSAPNTGVVVLSLSANATANIEGGRYVYDGIVVDSSNNVIRFVEGQVTVRPGVTAAPGENLNTEGE